MRHGENPIRESSETGVPSSFVSTLRSSVAGRALQLLLLLTACDPGRTGKYQIEIVGDPQATALLEELREKFKTASQSPHWNEEEIRGILAERRRLLEDFGIPGDTEQWWNTNNGDGPEIRIDVDEVACEQATRCKLAEIVKK